MTLTVRTTLVGVTSSVILAGGLTNFPSQSGHSGDVLSTDGSKASWVTPGAASLPTQSGNAGKYLTTDGTDASWGTVAGGSGTVTSIAASLSGVTFTGPVTAAGTLAGTWDAEAKNTVFAGPTSGANAVPTWRALVAADLPDVSSTYLTVAAAASTYSPIAGNAALVTLGTVTTGTWHGTAIGTQYGGLGADNSAASGVPLFASGTVTMTSTSGAGNFARVTSPTFVTPVLGAATATSLNGITFTTSAGTTVTIAAGKTVTVNNTLTLAGTDGSTLNVGTGGTLGTAAYTAASVYLLKAGGTVSGTVTFDVSSGTTVAIDNTKIFITDGATANTQLQTGLLVITGLGSTVSNIAVGEGYWSTDASRQDWSGGETYYTSLLSDDKTSVEPNEISLTDGLTTTTLEGDAATFGGDVTISGNLIVNGDTVTVGTATLSVEDPLIELGNANTANSVDLGIYVNYQPSSTLLYGGLFRDASDSGKWKLFAGLQSEPTTTVNTGGTGYSVATLVANVEGNLTGNADTSSKLATPRAIYGNNFDGSAALNQIIASTYGGTGNGFTKFSGPTTSEKTVTIPDANLTITEAAATVLDDTTVGAMLDTLGGASATGSGGVARSTSPRFTTEISPATNDAAALGTSSLMWSDLFLASGAVINFNNGDVTLTHGSDTLTLAGGGMAFGDNLIQSPKLKDISESVNVLGNTTGATNVDYSAAEVATLTLTGNATLTVTNPPASGSCGTLTMFITGNGSATLAITNIVWNEAGAPAVIGSSAVLVVTITTLNAGTTWRGSWSLYAS